MGLDQLELRLPGNHHLPLSKKFLPFGLLLGGGVLVIREAGLLAAHHPSPVLRLPGHCHVGGPDFPKTPKYPLRWSGY